MLSPHPPDPLEARGHDHAGRCVRPRDRIGAIPGTAQRHRRPGYRCPAREHGPGSQQRFPRRGGLPGVRGDDPEHVRVRSELLGPIAERTKRCLFLVYDQPSARGSGQTETENRRGGFAGRQAPVAGGVAAPGACLGQQHEPGNRGLLPPSWSPYSTSTVTRPAVSAAPAISLYKGVSGSRRAACQSPARPVLISRSRCCGENVRGSGEGSPRRCRARPRGSCTTSPPTRPGGGSRAAWPGRFPRCTAESPDNNLTKLATPE